MEFRQLEYFMRVYEENSFTLAAERLYISQSALSKAVKRLEDELDIALVEMSGKKLLFTEAGKLLYEQSKKICDVYNTTLGLLSNMREQEIGTVRIIASCQRGTLLWLYDIMEQYADVHPKICFEIVESEAPSVQKSVLTGQADIGLATSFNAECPDGLEEATLMRSQLWLLAPRDHPLMSKPTISYEDFKGLNIFTSYSDLSRAFTEECMKRGFRPNITLASSQTDIIISLVLEHQGIALVSFTPESMIPYMSKYHYPKRPKSQETYARRKMDGDRFSYGIAMYTRKELQRNSLIKSLSKYILTSFEKLQANADSNSPDIEFYDLNCF